MKLDTLNKEKLATFTGEIVADSVVVSPTPGQGLLLLMGTVVMVGAFIALNHVLGITDVWVAFLFLLYWGMIEKISFAKLPRCIIGALLGLLMGYLLQALPDALGTIGTVISFGAVLLLVYSLIMGWLPIAINAMTMLFITVVTIPTVQTQINFGSLLIALAFGIVYFSCLFALVNFIQKRMAKR